MSSRSNVLWHTWEPGMYSNSPTSSGGAIWTAYLWHRLEHDGFQIFTCFPDCDKDNENNFRRIDIDKLNEIDCGVFCWRWLLPYEPQYAIRNEYYYHQWRLIEALHSLGKKIIVHDQDHSIAPNDLDRLRSMNVILTAPELFPRYGFRTLMFPYPYSHQYMGENSYDLSVESDLIYVGNNYGRYTQFCLYFGFLPPTIIAHVYGNWLEPSPNRESIEKIKSDCPNVTFKGRLPQSQVIEKLRTATATVHLAKPTYCDTGFITIRWAEAVAAMCPAYIPDEFRLPRAIKQPPPISSLPNLTLANSDSWTLAVEDQHDFVKQIMRYEPWPEMIRS